MDLSLTQDEEMLRDSVIRFASRECSEELIRKMDEVPYYPHELYSKLAELGASDPRILLTAARQLPQSGGHYAMVGMCIAMGQGIAMVIERV